MMLVFVMLCFGYMMLVMGGYGEGLLALVHFCLFWFVHMFLPFGS